MSARHPIRKSSRRTIPSCSSSGTGRPTPCCFRVVYSIHDNLAQEEATVAREEEKLRLGKGSAFVKSRLKRLRQEDDTWEADFRALPKPMMQNETHYLGLVVTKRDGSTLAETQIEGRPSANDLAALLGKAMHQP